MSVIGPRPGLWNQDILTAERDKYNANDVKPGLHDRRYGIDPTKIKEDLGWYPETPFEKGIVLTIDWYLENEEWMNNVTSGNYQKYYEDMYKAKAEL